MRIKKPIKDIKIGDKIVGVDGNLHNVVALTPIHIPHRMFNVCFTNGSVECSDTHEWGYWDKGNLLIKDTLSIYNNLDYFKQFVFGKEEDGIKLEYITEITPKEVMCITTDAPYNLFKIFTNMENPIFTKNCGNRVFCGKATETGASKVALDNLLAMTVDDTYKGAGVFQAGGASDARFLRFYFTEEDSLQDYYAKRGLDPLGYSKYDSATNHSTSAIDENEELELNRNEEVFTFEIDEESIEIDHTKEQEWREV